MRKSAWLCACIAALTLAAAGQVQAAILHFEGFEDPNWVAGAPGNWQEWSGGSIARVESGTNGITSSGGNAHAVLTPGNGPFTAFGGYRTSFGAGFTASLDVFLDTSWENGQGFDYSVAANRQTGLHLRDFIFHVGVVNDELLVNASNNSDLAFNGWKLQNENNGNNFTVTSTGWYTLEHVFYDDGGSLAVDMNLLDDSGSLLHSITRSNPADDIATIVGGNRYGWFTFNNIDELAIDNTQLTAVPEPSSLVLAGMAVLGLAGGAVRRRRHVSAK